MQSAVPKNEGGMVAVLGSDIDTIEDLIEKKNHRCFIANDNTTGQLVISGRVNDLQNFINDLKDLRIKNIILPVSGPFHCELMNKATVVMNEESDYPREVNAIYQGANRTPMAVTLSAVLRH